MSSQMGLDEFCNSLLTNAERFRVYVKQSFTDADAVVDWEDHLDLFRCWMGNGAPDPQDFDWPTD